ncbi:MAG: aminodeoxychorismate synthase component I [Candidatus Omnitrophota bacterium]
MDILIEFERTPLYFSDPLSVIRCTDPAACAESFAKIECALKDGYYVAGFLSYEAGYCFEERLRTTKRYDFPLILMGVYKQPRPARFIMPARSPCRISGLSINISQREYTSHIESIRDSIARGDVYQITYCIKYRFSCRGNPQSLYEQLLRRQPVPYPAYIKTDEFSILSLSPERFFQKRSVRVITEPMKGTWPRGRTRALDRKARHRFSRDIKNRAENVMIADLLRNDLGRIAANVAAPKLFTIAQYRTLYQMTSTVTADISHDIPLYDLFAAIFPSGSVTGAPKIKAMDIIKSLEREERKIYTGAIGYISPDRDMYFNVPIRTLLIRGNEGEMGVGGGIVWDSTPQGEWDEGILKARFLTDLVRGL